MTATPPRTWTAMLLTLRAILGELCGFLPAPIADQGRRRAALAERMIGAVDDGGPVEPLRLAIWRWMWSLPPCSEARKAAFTLGAAALMIERWRGLQEIGKALAPLPDDAAAGQRAEALLRIAAWHIDDARSEAHGRALWHEPTIPPHERTYTSKDMPPHAARAARHILDDHFDSKISSLSRAFPAVGLVAEPERVERGRAAMAEAFAELAIASLPDGPWVMTTRDVERFLEFILEDGHARA